MKTIINKLGPVTVPGTVGLEIVDGTLVVNGVDVLVQLSALAKEIETLKTMKVAAVSPPVAAKTQSDDKKSEEVKAANINSLKGKLVEKSSKSPEEPTPTE